MNNKKWNVGIFIYDNVEVLDFAGPFEVFGVASNMMNDQLFEVFTIAEVVTPVSARNGLMIQANYTFDNHPQVDILVVPGGHGSRAQLHNDKALSWIKGTHASTKITMSVCSGSLLLAKLGYLDHAPYCTHHTVYDAMKELVPTGVAHPDKRFVASVPARIYTSAGISAGIDLSLYVVNQLHGENVLRVTTQEMEYDINPDLLVQ